ncbi:hypothetical protein EVAR_101012_1 [Eumeta japonica]|uniref:Uncharacterized protein n=1 Tax=Eumeta variegata TaxID=151549 RepID=A0A4C1ZW32_EUMVA|nr:hypothetical protein EVAR_101012_1 [Eumeta japonica]
MCGFAFGTTVDRLQSVDICLHTSVGVLLELNLVSRHSTDSCIFRELEEMGERAVKWTAELVLRSQFVGASLKACNL